VGQNLLPGGQRNFKNQPRPLFHHRGGHHPPRARRYGLVSTHGPFSVTATQCSKCAE
jgi:hypothetical protein